MTPARVIKRYSNRKLYDTSRSSYITLEEIAEMIRAGEEIRIIDNKTKEDLTSVTMAQILVGEEKRKKRGRPLPSLRGLIEQSGELIQRRITEPVHQIRSSVEDSVNKLIKTGEERAQETRTHIQAWFDQNTQALEEIQKRFDDRVKLLVGSLASLGAVQHDVKEVKRRLDRIEAHLGLDPLPELEPFEPDEPED